MNGWQEGDIRAILRVVFHFLKGVQQEIWPDGFDRRSGGSPRTTPRWSFASLCSLVSPLDTLLGAICLLSVHLCSLQALPQTRK